MSVPALHRLLAIQLVTFCAAFQAHAQTPVPGAASGASPLARIQVTLGFTVPPHIAEGPPVFPVLDVLSREPCDQQAIVELGKALEEVGYRREAAKAHVGFSVSCGGHAPSLRSAANTFLGLSDHQEAVSAATELIKHEPFKHNGYYLRAVSWQRGNQPKKAIDDYLTAIELFGDKQKISSAAFVGMATAYDKLGQFCEAAGAIDAWIAIDPVKHDTSQSRAIISEYRRKGSCPAGVASKTETFPLKANHAVVPAVINGVKGTFLVDTGATNVALRSSFAAKANIELDKDSRVLLSTANGMVQAHRGRARTIAVRTLSSTNVAVVVQSDEVASYGPGIDGLLGMSFLSRFQFSMDGKNLKLSAREGSPSVPAAEFPIDATPAPPSMGTPSKGPSKLPAPSVGLTAPVTKPSNAPLTVTAPPSELGKDFPATGAIPTLSPTPEKKAPTASAKPRAKVKPKKDEPLFGLGW